MTTGYDLLIPKPSPAPVVTTWATVTQTSPLRVQLDGDPGPLPITPDTLVAGLRVGDRVYVLLAGNADLARARRRVVVLGRANDLRVESWATVTQASPLRVQLDGDPDPLLVTPDTLVAGLRVGDRVWVQLYGNADPRVVILGRDNNLRAESWEPVWTTGGTPINLGNNGASVGRFIHLGQAVFFLARLTIGSDTVLGSGALGTANLPVDLAFDIQTADGFVRDASPSAHIPVTARLTSVGDGAISELFVTATGERVTATNPITPVSGDVYQVTGWYFCV